MELKDGGMPPPYPRRHEQYPHPAPPGPPMMVASPPPMVAVGHPIYIQQMGPRPTITVCKACNHQVETRVEFEPSTKTHLIALALCLVGCCLCACVPYCVDSCRIANHYCPQCNSFIGSYKN